METISKMRVRHANEKETLLKRALYFAEGNQARAARKLQMDRGCFIRDFKLYVKKPPLEWYAEITKRPVIKGL